MCPSHSSPFAFFGSDEYWILLCTFPELLNDYPLWPVYCQNSPETCNIDFARGSLFAFMSLSHIKELSLYIAVEVLEFGLCIDVFAVLHDPDSL